MTSTVPETSRELALREQAERTDLCRRVAAESKQRLAEAQAAFQAEHAALITEVAQLQAAAAEAEATLRDLAIAAYQATGEKHPAPGVGVSLTTTLDYDDVQALAWAREQGAALLLDRKGFEAIARALPLAFVTRSEVPKATLARDLGAALAAAQGVV